MNHSAQRVREAVRRGLEVGMRRRSFQRFPSIGIGKVLGAGIASGADYGCPP